MVLGAARLLRVPRSGGVRLNKQEDQIMPDYRKGDMWSVLTSVDHFIVTTNAVVKNDGALVMGAGLAKQARDRQPGLDKMFGTAIKLWHDPGEPYGCMLWANNTFGMFQVKHHYKDQANMHLIIYSTGMLQAFAQSNPTKQYALNFPGIGNGKLKYDDVKPVIDLLPRNVQVWTFK